MDSELRSDPAKMDLFTPKANANLPCHMGTEFETVQGYASRNACQRPSMHGTAKNTCTGEHVSRLDGLLDRLSGWLVPFGLKALV